MNISIPEFGMVLLVGPTASGKSTFAKRFFADTEVISSDHCRAIVSDDATDQSVTPEAFEILHTIVNARLQHRRLTVVDATNIQPQARKGLIELARKHDCRITSIVFDIPTSVLLRRNQERQDRDIPNRVVHSQVRTMRNSLRGMRREGVRDVHTLHGQDEVDAAEVLRRPMRSNLNSLEGPFDIFGDVHGCYDELATLMHNLGYVFGRKMVEDAYEPTAHHPDGRKAVFVGDLVDRGPGADLVLALVMNMHENNDAYCVMGNHEDKLLRTLRGNPTRISHGLQETLDSLEPHDDEFKARITKFLSNLPPHLTLDDGKLAIAHAGILGEYIGRQSSRIQQFCMYGETTGETDEWGLPVRYNWAQNYDGQVKIVYGHTPVAEPQWYNNTINLDTGCAFGGRLTALQYPEMDVVSVEAKKVYYESHKPLPSTNDDDALVAAVATAPNVADHFRLNLNETAGDQRIPTRYAGQVRVSSEHNAAALEIMSRFATDPRWLVYMPPTISPCETSKLDDVLEHPDEAFAYYRQQGVAEVVCEEKHMGSRGIIVVGKSSEAIQLKFGIESEIPGTCYTRTGRSFFLDKDTELAFMLRVQQAVTNAGLWDKLKTDWMILDTEIMPWSLKADGLLRTQYASTGAAAAMYIEHAQQAIEQVTKRGIDLEKLETIGKRYKTRADAITAYQAAYRGYCWPVEGLEGVTVAPFHVMATNGAVHHDKSHQWHLDVAKALAEADAEMFTATRHITVNVEDAADVSEAAAWWQSITDEGSEGMVVKPIDFTVQRDNYTVQPAIKCRGKQYLRIIYGPEYDLPENLPHLKRRNLRTKRSMAVREFALGVEGLTRFVNHEPLQRVHQCAFAVLALESEPVDPRL